MKRVAKIRKVVKWSVIGGGVGFVGHAIVDYVTLGVVNVGESIVAGVVLGLLAGLNEWRDSHEE